MNETSSGDRPRDGGAASHVRVAWSGICGPLGSDPIRVGAWTVDAGLNLLRRDGHAVSVEPKVMELLWFLARRPGQVVGRDELFDALWHGVVVADDALTQATIKLRRALGDDPRAPTYVQTVRKRGYRLIAEVAADTSLPTGEAPLAMGETPLRKDEDPLPVGEAPSPIGDAVMLAPPTPLQRCRPRWRWAMPALGTVLGAALIWPLLDGGAGTRASAPDPPAAAGRPVPPRPNAATTVDVLPFEVLGDHPEQHYLADGLAADLATDLSRLSELDAVRVHPNAGAPGSHADAAFRVRGAVQRAADRIAVEVRLEETATGRVLWSERYYRDFGDLFEIRDDIEARVVQALPGRISTARQSLDAHRYSRSVDAYDAFLKARAALLVRTEEGNEQAEALYLEAVGLDAAFARAYGGLALIHAANYRNQSADEGEVELRRVLEMARTAVRIDPELPEARWALGYVSAQRRDHDAALAHLDKALAMAPAYADAVALKGGIFTYIGRPQSSIPLLREAIRLKPSAGYLDYLRLGRAYFFLGDFEQAVINLCEATARNPANLEAHVYLAATLQRGGDPTGAEWEAEEVRTLAPAFATGQWLTTYPMTDPGQRETLASALARLGL